MAGVSVFLDTSDIFYLDPERGLYTKPINKIEIIVMFPSLKANSFGMTISNWEIMEKLKLMIHPLKFQTLKICKMLKFTQINPLILKKLIPNIKHLDFEYDINMDNEFLYLEAEIETYNLAINIVDILNGKRQGLIAKSCKDCHYSVIKLSGINSPLKVRSSFYNQKKSYNDNLTNDNTFLKFYLLKPYINTLPLQFTYKDDYFWLKNHWLGFFDWDNIIPNYGNYQKRFIDSKPGLRPDTVVVKGLPTKWFLSNYKECDFIIKLEEVVHKVFGTFGNIKAVDIPYFDNSADQLEENKICQVCKSKNVNIPLTFESYIQYQDYDSFERAMQTLVSSKLLHTTIKDLVRGDGTVDLENKEFYTSVIQIDFDRSKHMTESAFSKRMLNKKQKFEVHKLLQNSTCLGGNCMYMDNSLLSNDLTNTASNMNQTLQKFNPNGNIVAFKLKTLPKTTCELFKSWPPHDPKKGSPPLSPVQIPEKRKRLHNRKDHKKKQKELARERERLAREAEKKQQKELLAERRLLLAQRKRDSLRLLNYLFTTINNKLVEKEEKDYTEAHDREAELAVKLKRKRNRETRTQDFLVAQEVKLRQKLVDKFSQHALEEIKALIS